ARTVFLLVSHNPGRLLPTIRSRCRTLRFQPLDDDVMASAIRQVRPDIGEFELEALMAAGKGAPGRALRYAGIGISELDGAIAALITEGDADNCRRSELAQSLGLKKALPRYEAFLERAPAAVEHHARQLRGPDLSHAIVVWEEARALAGSASRSALDPKATVFALAGMLASLHEPAHG
ncbi:MAG: DNA polymerase III subunit delta', partial [Sphingomonadales bacterium]|nr:DNA polymerase III subunit delta' [Sphingomonadales bacterium]